MDRPNTPVRMALALFVVAMAQVLAGVGCAPTERYYTNKNTPPPAPAPVGADGACGMATPNARLQSRSSNQRSVEGFGSFPCTPTPAGAAPR